MIDHFILVILVYRKSWEKQSRIFLRPIIHSELFQVIRSIINNFIIFIIIYFIVIYLFLDHCFGWSFLYKTL